METLADAGQLTAIPDLIDLADQEFISVRNRLLPAKSTQPS